MVWLTVMPIKGTNNRAGAANIMTESKAALQPHFYVHAMNKGNEVIAFDFEHFVSSIIIFLTITTWIAAIIHIVGHFTQSPGDRFIANPNEIDDEYLLLPDWR